MSGAAPAFARAEWCAFLNRMLEAERAGARALLEFLGEYPRDGEAWKVLRKVQGDKFDERYVDFFGVPAHEEAVHLFEREAKRGSNAALRDFAQNTLQTLREHLQRARDLHSQMSAGHESHGNRKPS